MGQCHARLGGGGEGEGDHVLGILFSNLTLGSLSPPTTVPLYTVKGSRLVHTVCKHCIMHFFALLQAPFHAAGSPIHIQEQALSLSLSNFL